MFLVRKSELSRAVHCLKKKADNTISIILSQRMSSSASLSSSSSSDTDDGIEGGALPDKTGPERGDDHAIPSRRWEPSGDKDPNTRAPLVPEDDGRSSKGYLCVLPPTLLLVS